MAGQKNGSVAQWHNWLPRRCRGAAVLLSILRTRGSCSCTRGPRRGALPPFGPQRLDVRARHWRRRTPCRRGSGAAAPHPPDRQARLRCPGGRPYLHGRNRAVSVRGASAADGDLGVALLHELSLGACRVSAVEPGPQHQTRRVAQPPFRRVAAGRLVCADGLQPLDHRCHVHCHRHCQSECRRAARASPLPA